MHACMHAGIDMHITHVCCAIIIISSKTPYHHQCQSHARSKDVEEHKWCEDEQTKHNDIVDDKTKQINTLKGAPQRSDRDPGWHTMTQLRCALFRPPS